MKLVFDGENEDDDEIIIFIIDTVVINSNIL